MIESRHLSVVTPNPANGPDTAAPTDVTWPALLADFAAHLQQRSAEPAPQTDPQTSAGLTTKELDLVERLDGLGVPDSAGRRVARRALEEAGEAGVPNSTALDRACAWRRDRPAPDAEAPRRTKLARSTSAAGRMAHLERFARECWQQPAAVERSTILEYLAKPEWATGTRKAHRVSLVDLFSWSHASGRLPFDPTVDLPATPEILPRDTALAALPPLTPQARHLVASGHEHPARAWARQADYPHAASGRLTTDVLRAWQLAGFPSVSLAGDSPAARWARLLDDYDREQQARGLRPATLALRRAHLLHFAKATQLDPTAVDRQALTDYLANPAWSPETRKGHRSSLKTMFSWAYESGRLSYNPAARLPGVRVPIGVPQPAPEPVIRDAINGARPDVRVMILLGAMAGLRRAEIAHLHADAITEDGLRIVGKGGRVRMVPMHPALSVELDGYCAARGIVSGYLFCAIGSDTPLTVQHVGKLISDRMPPGWSAHKLRTRFGSRAYAGAYDLRAVQELLGHSSPAVTARYVAIPSTALTAAVQSVPPVPGLETAHPADDARRTPGRARNASSTSDDRE